MTPKQKEIHRLKQRNKIQRLLNDIRKRSEQLGIYKNLSKMPKSSRASIVRSTNEIINRLEDEILKIYDEVEK